MMTLPESGGTPLVSCQRLRQTEDRRLSAARAPGGRVSATLAADPGGVGWRLRRDSRQRGRPSSPSSAMPCDCRREGSGVHGEGHRDGGPSSFDDDRDEPDASTACALRGPHLLGMGTEEGERV